MGNLKGCRYYQRHLVRYRQEKDRLNGKIRDREKAIKSLKTDDLPILANMHIFHNYPLRGLMTIQAKEPIKKNKTKEITLIQNANKCDSK